jgi:hypothetical protein
MDTGERQQRSPLIRTATIHFFSVTINAPFDCYSGVQ